MLHECSLCTRASARISPPSFVWICGALTLMMGTYGQNWNIELVACITRLRPWAPLKRHRTWTNMKKRTVSHVELCNSAEAIMKVLTSAFATMCVCVCTLFVVTIWTLVLVAWALFGASILRLRAHVFPFDPLLFVCRLSFESSQKCYDVLLRASIFLRVDVDSPV